MSEILQSQETIKLFEYDITKPELSEEELEHFGIPGMKWGVRKERERKGGFIKRHRARKLRKRRIKTLKKARKIREQNKLAKQQEQKSKEDIINSKDIASMLKNVDKFSNQEINDVLNRISTEQRLSDMVKAQSKASMTRGQKVKEAVKESVKSGATSAAKSMIKTVAENSLKLGTKTLLKNLVDDESSKEVIEKLFKEKKK